MSNAFRYAKTKVEMEVFLTCSELQIRIKDDGVGFTIDKQKATELFYQQNVKDSLKHSGMGMYSADCIVKSMVSVTDRK